MQSTIDITLRNQYSAELMVFVDQIKSALFDLTGEIWHFWEVVENWNHFISCSRIPSLEDREMQQLIQADTGTNIDCLWEAKNP